MQYRVNDHVKMVKARIMQLFAPGTPDNQRAQELVEYALLVGFIAVSVAAVIPYNVTGPISTIFNKIEQHLVTNGQN